MFFNIYDGYSWYDYLIRWVVMVVVIITVTGLLIAFGYVNKDKDVKDWLPMKDVMPIAYTYISWWCIIILIVLGLTLLNTPLRTLL
jgi:heme/copper-type cytochrome/quinol oxidase subunit 2